jgi:hypothetical protein
MAGAPQGNDNRVKGKRWQTAIDNALAKRGSRAEGIQALDALAEKLLSLAEDGDLGALKELGDRLDGKPSQAVDLGSDPDRPIVQKVIREIVRPPNTDG